MSFIKLLRLFKIILFTFKDKIECYIRFLLSKMNKIEKPTKDIKLKKIFSIKLIPSPVLIKSVLTISFLSLIPVTVFLITLTLNVVS